MTRTDIRRLLCGKLLCLGIALALSSCRSDKPPAIDICILDGVGGGDCVLKDGTQRYMLPSEMKNMWSTTQADMAAYSSWCYKAPIKVIEEQMQRVHDNALSK